MADLTPINDALQKLLAAVPVLTTERVPLTQAAGRVLAADVQAGFDLPLFDNSAMDGFAVRAADLSTASPQSPVTLEVVADLPAGVNPEVWLAAGQAARIMTGAPLPEGADAVVPVEDTDFPARQVGVPAPEKIRVFRSLQPGDYVRPRGQDVKKGETVLTAPHRLRAQDLGVLAMLGQAEVEVFRAPKVGLMTPGDELLPLDAPLEPGKLYESNSYTLAALIERLGGRVVRLGIVRDGLEAVQQRLAWALEQGVDLLLSTGGVSVGAFDFVRAVLEREGELRLWRVNMRPGKPLAFGRYRGVPYIGLPGNPVSAFVGFQVFVRPVLLKMMGLPTPPRLLRRVVLAEPVTSDGRESYLRVILSQEDGRWVARLAGHQGSGNLQSLVRANALLIVPAGVTSLAAGEEAEAWLYEG
ncbi:MAG: molybdopterin molybdenumtransferase MoeA [Anaerolineae bacterium]|nr:MAG: molybdopterin molybdenumtransferase MoeA [Anaerolineae bacterium]